jgi:hypothetical protein
LKNARRFTRLAAMSGGARILRGPWPAPEPSPEVEPEGGTAGSAEARQASEADEARDLTPGRMHLGFIVRECAVALGRAPTPAELADWANHQIDERGEFCLFGRKITAAEARIILAHPGRPVTVRPERARPRV